MGPHRPQWSPTNWRGIENVTKQSLMPSTEIVGGVGGGAAPRGGGGGGRGGRGGVGVAPPPPPHMVQVAWNLFHLFQAKRVLVQSTAQ
jgi:hypothetical protein